MVAAWIRALTGVGASWRPATRSERELRRLGRGRDQEPKAIQASGVGPSVAAFLQERVDLVAAEEGIATRAPPKEAHAAGPAS